MEKKNSELEVINGIEKLNNNTLEHVKGGISDTDEKCCEIQFACNNKSGKGKSGRQSGAQTLSIH